jgi:transcriptional regulator with XRE-family HTH domain
MDVHGTTLRAIARAVGTELRKVRDSQRLTRAEVAERLPSGVSVQTIANYEYGIRHCTLVRFVEICEALEVPSGELLGLALQRAEISLDTNAVHVDLGLIANDNRARSALRKWARNRLIKTPDVTVTRLDPATVDELATFFDIDRREFVRYLCQYTPH